MAEGAACRDQSSRSLSLTGLQVDTIDCTTDKALDSIPPFACIEQVAELWKAYVLPLQGILERSDYAENEKSFLRVLGVGSSDSVEWEPFGAALFNLVLPGSDLGPQWQGISYARKMVQ